MASHAHMSGHLSNRQLRALLAYKRRRHDAGAGADWYVESNPFLVGFADVLGDAWKNPTIIHVVRDPREHARSALNHGTGRGLKALANRLLPFWFPDVRRVLHLDHRPSWIEAAAGMWVIANQCLTAAAARYPEYHLLHYENIFDTSHSGLRELCQLLGLEYREANLKISPSKRINAARLEVMGHWRDWSADACREVERICQPMMREYGYGNEPEWLAKVSSSPR